MSISPKSGRCLCGAVRFTFTGEPHSQSFCHCESCRRATSSPFTAWFTVDAGGVIFTGEARRFHRSSPQAMRSFCGVCGSPLSYSHDEKPGEIDLYAASLDDPSGFRPTLHTFWSEHLPWAAMNDELPKVG